MVAAVYAVIAYVLMPVIWKRYESRHPAFADAATVTRAGDGAPGDPLNLALIGSEEHLHRAMLKAGWYPADPITLASSIRIAGDVLLRRTYNTAPVSNLYLFGRKEDFAFERPVGDTPTKRHHVRFWRSSTVDGSGYPAWFGAATLDSSVGLSHETGQVTHHISPDVDAERDLIIAELRGGGDLSDVYWVDPFQQVRSGRNGGGDPWQTDGRLAVGVLRGQSAAATEPTSAPAATSPSTRQ